MNSNDNLKLEIEEPFTIRVEKPASTKKNSVCLWLRRIVTLDDAPNQKHHRPVFIIVMCILHVFLYLLTYINTNWKGQDFAFTLLELCMLFVPCMRPTPHDIRIRIVSCKPPMKNATCYYDDVLKNRCFSFMYPHQLWRMVTVNLIHVSWYHLLANVSMQFVQGIPLERKYGSARVAVIYWLSNLGAALSFMLIDREKCK
jgi:membrane associated rhomboid family serine protease